MLYCSCHRGLSAVVFQAEAPGLGSPSLSAGQPASGWACQKHLMEDLGGQTAWLSKGR